jgi:hypothetical protein
LASAVGVICAAVQHPLRVGGSCSHPCDTQAPLVPDGKFQLLHEQESLDNTQEYYQSLIDIIISIERVREFMIAMAELIQRLGIARLHVIGDIYDRGPGAHIILDTLMAYHSVDIQ